MRPIARGWRAAALTAAGVLAVTGLQASPSAAAFDDPGSITSVTTDASSGQLVLKWASSGVNTDYFLLQTAHTSFSEGSRGRNATTFKIPGGGSVRQFALTDTHFAQAGAAVTTGRHLYFRMSAVNETTSGLRTRAFPYLRAMMPPGLAAKRTGTALRAATFNVRTARATTDKRHWVVRKAAVAAEIKASLADVVAIQEMSPGRQDGRNGSTLKVGRQTTSLLTELKKIGLGHFKLVRTTSYRKSGTKHGSQGARILYNSKRFELLSNCPEKTGKKYYNASCTIQMPIMSNDSETRRRKAAYAAFEDRGTGKRFYFVSAHLDQRHSTSATVERRYNQLRNNQMRTVLTKIEQINSRNRAVIFGGDINSFQNNFIGDAPHDALVEYGYYDTVAATKRINLAFPTVNHYKTYLPQSTVGMGTRIDVVMVQGAQGAHLYWNKLKDPDSKRPSDHNLVAADIVL